MLAWQGQSGIQAGHRPFGEGCSAGTWSPSDSGHVDDSRRAAVSIHETGASIAPPGARGADRR